MLKQKRVKGKAFSKRIRNRTHNGFSTQKCIPFFKRCRYWMNVLKMRTNQVSVLKASKIEKGAAKVPAFLLLNLSFYVVLKLLEETKSN